MLTIQSEQLLALSLGPFRNWMVGHVKEFFPEQCEVLGESGIREAIEYGISRAKNYGIVNDGDVAQYIDVMFAFGRDFDTDPQFPWADAILNDMTEENAPAKSARLYHTAMEYLRELTTTDS
jgi:hypothetical protein